MDGLKSYAPRDNKYVEAKNKLLSNVENFCKRREKTIEGFKNGVFPLHYNEANEYQMKTQREKEEEEQKKQKEKQKKQEEQKEESKESKFF